MPGLAQIWRAGVGKLGGQRKLRELNRRLASLRDERQTHVFALGKVAWGARRVNRDFSPAAGELYELDERLGQLRIEKERRQQAVASAAGKLDAGKRETSKLIERAAEPYNQALARYNKVEDHLSSLKRERNKIEQLIELLRDSENRLARQVAQLVGEAGSEETLARKQRDLASRRRNIEESKRRLADIDRQLPQLESESSDRLRDVDASASELRAREDEVGRTLSELKRELMQTRRAERELESRIRAGFESEIPLIFRLGEELNVRRLKATELRELYLLLDDQIRSMRELHAAVAETQSSLDGIDVGATRWFWVLATSVGVLLVFVVALLFAAL